MKDLKSVIIAADGLIEFCAARQTYKGTKNDSDGKDKILPKLVDKGKGKVQDQPKRQKLDRRIKDVRKLKERYEDLSMVLHLQRTSEVS